MRFFILLMLLTLNLCAETKIVIGISGGTGSGKTTLAENLMQVFSDRAALICQDGYYKDISHLPVEERAKTNFDHPNSIDFQLLKEHILQLKAGEPIDIPIYNYCTHAREPIPQKLEPKEILIVEGILLFALPEIRDLFDLKIFVDTDDDIRLLRRIERDMRMRGRDFTSIRDQYLKTVKPMHDAFVEPNKRYADIIIPAIKPNETGIALLVAGLKKDLNFMEEKEKRQ